MSSLLLAIVLFLLPCFLVLASSQQQSTITMGSFITATKSGSGAAWTSPSSRFAFGFYAVQNEFAIGIWFVANGAVIWTADRDGKLLPVGSIVNLTNDGLQLLSTNGDRAICNIATANIKLESASMKDSGNFVILDVNKNVTWQSFDHPTDTLIAGQIVRLGDKIVSNASVTDRSSGRFQFVMLQDGNLIQCPVNTPDTGAYAYWAANTSGDGYTSVRLRNDGAFYLLTDVSPIHNDTVDPSYTYFSRMETDGFYRAYRTNSSSTELLYANPSADKCSIKGVCGSNSYCKYTDSGDHSTKGEATCICFPGFAYTDQSKPYMGCQRNFSMAQCAAAAKEGSTTYSIVKLPNLSWSDDPYNYTYLVTEEDCSDSCLRDCNCYAALFADQRCRKQRYPFLYAKRMAGDPTVAFLKVGSTESNLPALPEVATDSIPSTKALLLSVALACTLILSFSAVFFFLYLNIGLSYQKKLKNMEDGVAGGMAPRSFTYRELVEATDNFSDKQGEGSFSIVFKGKLPLGNGEFMSIAVKRLKELSSGKEKGFRSEMRAVGGAHHRNLVRLLGFCHEGTKLLLIYEYMGRGSLDRLIFPPAAPEAATPPVARETLALPAAQDTQDVLDEAQGSQLARENKAQLSWKDRTGIAMNVARGILYLHEGLRPAIIHCDIKPANVLVADDGMAKIGDLGLAKFLKPFHSKMYIKETGTGHYIAPELTEGIEELTPKADVYSFGILLLELIACRTGVQRKPVDDRSYLSEWAYECMKNSTLEQLVPGGEEVDKGELEKMVMVALWCLQKSSKDRKSMKEVVRMLGGKMTVAVPPDSIHLYRD